MNKNLVNGLRVLAVLLITGGLYWSSQYNYLLFHSLAELFSVVIAATFFVIVWNARDYAKQKFNYLEFIGIAYLFVAGLDFLHLLAFKGMPIFEDYDYYANQLWIGARYLESLSLLVPFVLLRFRRRYIHPHLTFAIYTFIFSGIVASIFVFKIFPICFIEGYGQTPFKIFSEYIIILILFVDLLLLLKNKKVFNITVYQYLFASTIFTIFSELGFTAYTDNYDVSNLFGHVFKIISFYLVYKAIIITCINEPYKTIFKELKDKEAALYKTAMTDELTGLYNRRAAIELMGKVLKNAARAHEKVSVCFIDVDNLKKTNDTYGHDEGDNLLKTVARHMVSQARESDYTCRIGGDEFLLILPNTPIAESEILIKRITAALDQYNLNGLSPYPVDFSYGFSEYDGQGPVEIDKLLDQADDKMYQNKMQKRWLDEANRKTPGD